jgi:hypothetical protein
MDAGEEGDLGVVTSPVTVRHPREDAEIVAVLLKDFQITAGGVVATGALWEEVGRMHAEWPPDQQEAFWCSALRLGCECARSHRIEEREGDCDA